MSDSAPPVTANDVLAAAQKVIDLRNALGISVDADTAKKAEYDAAHTKALSDNADYSGAFDSFQSLASAFTKEQVDIP